MFRIISVVWMTLTLVACGGGGGGGATPAPEQYSLSINASNLVGSIEINLNQSEDLSFNSDGAHSFNTTFASGASYQVSIKQQPAGQNCQLSQSNGEFGSADIALDLSCSNNSYTIGGQASGLNGQLSLNLNNSESLVVNANGNFNFSTALAHQSAFSVAIEQQPSGQTCQLSNASGHGERRRYRQHRIDL